MKIWIVAALAFCAVPAIAKTGEPQLPGIKALELMNNQCNAREQTATTIAYQYADQVAELQARVDDLNKQITDLKKPTQQPTH